MQVLTSQSVLISQCQPPCLSELKSSIRNMTLLPWIWKGALSVERELSVTLCALIHSAHIYWRLLYAWALFKCWGYYLKQVLAHPLNLGIRWENRQLKPLRIIEECMIEYDNMKEFRKIIQYNYEWTSVKCYVGWY